jgi:hypothetical protein
MNLTASEQFLCCAEDSDSLDNIESESQSRCDVSGAASLSSSMSMSDEFLLTTQGENCHEVLLAMQEQQKEYMADGEKMKNQGDEVFLHRKKVIICMADICQKLRFYDSTFFSAVNILDRFLSVHTVKQNEKVLFPLIGIASVSIAAKMAEVCVPSLRSLQEFMGCELPFHAGHIRRMEMGILNSLEWKMACITPCTVIPYLMKVLLDSSQDCISDQEAKVIYSSSMQVMKKFVYKSEYVGYTAMEVAAASIMEATTKCLRVETTSEQKLFCHDFLAKQLNKGRKRDRNGGMLVLALLSACMADMESVDLDVDFYATDYPYKRHLSRSLSPTTPLGSCWAL